MKSVLLQRLAYTRGELIEVVGHLSDELVGWAPVEGMRTVGGQLIEIAASELQLHQALVGESVTPWEEVLAATSGFASLEDHVGYLSDVRDGFVAMISGLSDAELAAQTDRVANWSEGLGLPTVSVYDAIVGICQHESYHTGQLVSYLWARGDNPYKW